MSEIKKKIFDLRNNVDRIAKEQTNPFYDSQYFNINDLLEHLNEKLKERDLLLTQPVRDGRVYSIIEDLESGESEEAWIDLPQYEDPQKTGSAITYFRRYTLKSLLALQEEDDDANRASKGGKTSGSQDDEKPWLNKTEDKSDELTKEWKQVVARITKDPSALPKVYDHYKVNKESRAELEQIASEAKNTNAAKAQGNDAPF